VLIVMRKEADAGAQDNIKAYLIERGFDIHQSTGANRVIIGVIGDTESIPEKDIAAFPGVLQVVRIAKED
jgi:Na+/H+-translocating membrane pyrophosphatase